MHRKILGLCAALVALGALAIAPTMASATTLQDTSGGVTTKVSGKIKAISDGTAVFTAGELKVKCNENYITGTVVKNDGTTVEGTIEAAGFDSNLTAEATKCESSLGNTTVAIPGLTNEGGASHWCIKNVAGEDNWEVIGNNCGQATGTLTFVLTVKTVLATITCRYTSGEKATGTFTTPANHEASTLSLVKSPNFKKEEVSSGTCPAEGKISEMKFNLYTDKASGTATTEWDDATSTANPVFFTNP